MLNILARRIKTLLYTLDHTPNATLLLFIISQLLLWRFRSNLEYDEMSYFEVRSESFIAIDILQD